MIFEPKWKSLMANTTAPIFSPAQCQDIINMGHQQKAQEAKVGVLFSFTPPWTWNSVR